jgi:soluble lytic murein transglycosylase-like protein
MSVRGHCAFAGAVALSIAVGAGTAQAQVPHTIEPGESLWSIAAEDGLTVEELAAANGLSPDAHLIAGATLLIPPASNAEPPYPTDEVVTPEQVGSIAAEYGMSGPLVQSIAWNESSFHNSAVSSAGARGVMQIMPDTWDFISGQLTEQPLDPDSALDNVKAGVIYLHYLYHVKDGDGDATVASYFQGPNREGLLPETETYVREVREDQAEFAAGD